MSNANITVKAAQGIWSKYLITKAHVFMYSYLSFWSFRVADCDTTAFLSSVLKGK